MVEHLVKNILVTGGLGFIGSNWVNENFKGNKIIVVDNFSIGSNKDNLTEETKACVEVLNLDIGDDDFISQFRHLTGSIELDYIVHFAAESHVDRSIENPTGFVKTNVMGTTNMLNLARQHEGVRFLHVSTDEVFGHLEWDDEPFTEDTKYEPRSPYSASKAASDHIVRAYHATYGLDVVITNCCNNYGPRQYPEKLIPVVINAAIEGKDIPVYGTGENVREWIHVLDHNSAITKVLYEGESGETYCIGSDLEMTNENLVRMICRTLDRLKPKNGLSYSNQIKFVTDRAGHDFRYAIDSSKIKEKLNWKPQIEFEEGLENTIKWYLGME